MSHLKQYSYPGYGVDRAAKLHYSTAIRVVDTIQCAGQGGWDRETFEIPKDLDKQIAQAFENCEFALKDAGGKGFEQVYKVITYHDPMDQEAVELTVKYLTKYTPNHKPILTCVGVTALADERMRIEIEVFAHDPEGAK